MAKKKINSYAKNTTKLVLKGATKALGLGLVGSGIAISALSKKHFVKGIGAMAVTVMCPTLTVCAIEALLAKNIVSGIINDTNTMDGLTKDLQKSSEITSKLIHEIGKGLQETGNIIGRESDKIKLDR